MIVADTTLRPTSALHNALPFFSGNENIHTSVQHSSFSFTSLESTLPPLTYCDFSHLCLISASSLFMLEDVFKKWKLH
jgi:hypothetical protein